MKFDLKQAAERLQAAAERSSGLTVEVTATDLVFSRDGHGTGRSESLPFAALFLQPDDLVAKALDRLGQAGAG